MTVDTEPSTPTTTLISHIITSFTAPISSLPSSTPPPPTPLYAPAEVPRIKKAKRLTTTRTKQLIRAADRAHDDPPPPPGLGECCGSSCDPCVNDLWREELACWRERWGDGAVEGGAKKKMDDGGKKVEGDGDIGCQKRMPGSFDW